MIELEALIAIVGPNHVLIGEDVRARSTTWGEDDPCTARAIVRPGTSAEVAEIVAKCAAAGQVIVPHGGRTGLAGGVSTSKHDIALSLERLTQLEINTVDRVAIAGAGVPIQKLQEAADAAGLAFCVDFGARGTAMVGGAISTNAGGNRVFRFGMMRDQVLGIEAVLADGTRIDAMKGLIKDNSGFDLKQIFIGSEGCLGVVTGAVLRLRPKLASRQTALIAVGSFESMLWTLAKLETMLGGKLSAFELMWPDFYATVIANESRPPIGYGLPYYVLVESEGSDSEADEEAFEAVLVSASESGWVLDAVIAKSDIERTALWKLRDNIWAIYGQGHHIDFDVGLPASAMESYVARIIGAVEKAAPGARCFLFGHVADGNLHVIVSRAESFGRNAADAVKQAIYRPLAALRGSVSAEHGIGLGKKPYLGYSRTPPELEMMRLLKRSLDPRGILNPGKIID